jgi:cadmium resistance protein CadD (predicted permease)
LDYHHVFTPLFALWQHFKDFIYVHIFMYYVCIYVFSTLTMATSSGPPNEIELFKTSLRANLSGAATWLEL